VKGFLKVLAAVGSLFRQIPPYSMKAANSCRKDGGEAAGNESGSTSRDEKTAKLVSSLIPKGETTMYELMYLALAMILWVGAPQAPDYGHDDQTAQEATLKGGSIRRDRTVETKLGSIRRDRTVGLKGLTVKH